VVCRTDDDSLVLRIKEEKVLSALPLGRATTAQKIGTTTRMSRDDVIGSIRYLVEQGLIEPEGISKHDELYILTGAGADHWQRRRTGRRADLPPLPVRSERIREVLSYLAREGPTRTRDVGEALDVSPTSINALMQYLKRKGLVRKSDRTHTAPYEVTDHGRKTLAEMSYPQMNLAA
jgi:predicted transcriptional regulator